MTTQQQQANAYAKKAVEYVCELFADLNSAEIRAFLASNHETLQQLEHQLDAVVFAGQIERARDIARSYARLHLHYKTTLEKEKTMSPPSQN